MSEFVYWVKLALCICGIAGILFTVWSGAREWERRFGKKVKKERSHWVKTTKCQKCGRTVEVIVGGVGRCPGADCANYYSWDSNVLWWNEGGTGTRFTAPGDSK